MTLFNILTRLFSASIITTTAYTLLGGSTEEAFAVFALMLLTVWSQEWIIDKARKHIKRRRNGRKKQAAPRRCRRCA